MKEPYGSFFMTNTIKMTHLKPEYHQFIGNALAQDKPHNVIISNLVSQYQLTIPDSKHLIDMVLSLNNQATSYLAQENNSSVNISPLRMPFITQLLNNNNQAVVDGRVVNFVFNMKDPEVVLIDNFLSDLECQHLIDLATVELKKSTVAVHGKGESVESEYRTSDGAGLHKNQDSIVTAIEDRISLLFNWNNHDTDSIQLLRYQIGQQYKPHYDFFADGSSFVRNQGERIATLILYLDEPSRGGTTSFPDLKLQVHCKRGSALFFSYPDPVPESRTLHAGEPVIEGTKWIATKWFRSLDKQDF